VTDPPTHEEIELTARGPGIASGLRGRDHAVVLAALRREIDLGASGSPFD
jgi:hypothetical protein